MNSDILKSARVYIRDGDISDKAFAIWTNIKIIYIGWLYGNNRAMMQEEIKQILVRYSLRLNKKYWKNKKSGK